MSKDNRVSDELLPCPFCGGTAKLSNYRVAEDAMGCHVACTKCLVQTDVFEDAYTPFEQAIRTWNTRSNPVASGAAEMQNAVCQALLDAFPMDDKIADNYAAVAVKALSALLPKATAPVVSEPVDDADEAYEIGKRDGYEQAVQDIDRLTGGDGEYRYCTDHDPERHTPDADTMKARISDRFSSLSLPAQEPVRQITEIKMTPIAEGMPKRDEMRGEQTILTYNDRVGTWDISFMEAGWDDFDAGFALGVTHWLDISEMWPGVTAQISSYFTSPLPVVTAGWMPIERAPKDGSVFLGCARNGKWIGQCKYVGPSEKTDKVWFMWQDGWPQPSLWMPLPPPPVALEAAMKEA